ncbi:MAG: hypothetical protein LBU69_02480, partial [Deltaproteobacteria bacterium]|nr:hypothetical protein [Deltaproteobacteria bacterium]
MAKVFASIFALLAAVSFNPLSLCAQGATATGGVGGEYKISLLITDSDSYMIHKAVAALETPPGISVRSFCLVDLQGNQEMAEYFDQSQLVIVDVMDDNLSGYVIAHNLLFKAKVYAIRGSKDDKALRLQGFEFNPDISDYFDSLTSKNVANMVRRAIALNLDPGFPYGPVEKGIENGLYHPAAPRIFGTADEYLSWLSGREGHDPAKPLLAVMFFST